MNQITLPSTFAKQVRTFHPPDIPPESWCDFRIAYEQHRTLKEIANAFICDPLTVKHCILLNKSSKELGRQLAPTKLTPYINTIDQIYMQLPSDTTICTASRIVTKAIEKQGYSGSERTVRNYLRNRTLSKCHTVSGSPQKGEAYVKS